MERKVYWLRRHVLENLDDAIAEWGQVWEVNEEPFIVNQATGALEALRGLRSRLVGQSREHITGGEPCWCDPIRLMVCPECELDERARQGCWRCRGAGHLKHDGTPGTPVLFIHKGHTPEGGENDGR